MSVPVLETERLILRGHAASDFPAYARMWADPNVTRFIGGAPLSEEEAWGKFLRTFGMWAATGFGFWSVVEKGSGLRVGETGFLEGRREIFPSLQGIPEVGWALVPQAQGKGLATEAVRAVLGWGDSHFGKVRMACIIAPENIASRRVADKTGFRETRQTTYKGEPTVMLFRDP
jgi:RimJ/RimL family protein N-acetyltransferase